MRPYGYFDLTLARLRAHPFHELLAATGIAIGVALALAVLTANSSVSRSSEEIVRGVTGAATLQVQARSGNGVPAEDLLPRVRAIPGVERAAALLEQHAVLVGPSGTQSVNVVAVDADLAALSGQLTRSFAAGALSLTRGVVLPKATATAIGIPTSDAGTQAGLPAVRIELRGHAATVPVALVVGPDTLGPVADARAAVMSVPQLRAISALPDRISRILVQTEPGRERAVRAQLERLAGGRLTVADVNAEPRMLDEALKPTGQATSFFAIVAALLGFLLAFNAVLLSAPERRRWLADLITINGASPRTVVALVLVQSLLLGVVGSAIGVVLGLVLATGLLHESPDYLAPAFTLGSRTVISPVPLLVSVSAGLLACVLASAPLLLDLRPGRSLESVYDSDEDPGQALARGTTLRLLVAAAALIVGALAILAFLPSAALVACGLFAVATVFAVPATFLAIVAGASAIERRSPRLVMLSVAVRELRATTLRSLALAATGAVAVFGAVAIGGARQDLLRGIEAYTDDYVGTADLWIIHARDNQATNAFPINRADLDRLAAVPGVRAVRSYYGGFLDIGDRRVWVIARPSSDRALVPPSQMRDGTAARADARIRSGGWASISEQLASTLDTKVGDTITLPTPTGPRRLKVASTTSNLGWSPGAVVMNAADYRAWWDTDDPSALQVDLAAGATAQTVARTLTEELADMRSGLHVQTAEQRRDGIVTSARSGLARLGQISTLLLISACLAMAAALGAAIWQRRPRLAEDALLGVLPIERWRALLIESALVVGAGCLTGAVVGVLGQIVIDRYLVDITGFPVDIVIATWPALVTFTLVLASAMVVVAIPGWFAARVSAERAFDL
ncbi:protein of unknown function DUF214 [Conexibacter woesei DSM 14684]|uniref:Uncharacterized protein n=2 Tax=Conexibacter TaxID=191494 RepID=D3F7Y7_CONWI|nr:protein of unknown function DUF214 [Conexibacter woesei DSM 14684]